MKRDASTAILAQAAQAGVSFALQILVLRLLGVDQYGRFAVLYGVIVLAMAIISGLVGDSLVVLHRDRPSVRAALELTSLVVTLGFALIAMFVALGMGFTSVPETVAFGVAVAAFVAMEIVRRLLIAHVMFLRTVVADLLGFGVTLLIVVLRLWTGQENLATFLFAVAAGQTFGALLGWRLLPKSDRFLVPIRHPALATVWRYGSWRSLQQMLRPGLYTAVRILVLQFSGVAAVGMLEAARTYVSPLILVVGGFSSLLFVRFADHVKAGGVAPLRDADRVVVALVLISIGLSAIALVLRPWVGPLIFEVDLDAVAVVAWIAYGLSVAMVTPYGAICAVSGRQSAVFAIRLGDTVLAIVGTLIALALGASFNAIPFVLAVASAAGGVALRFLAAHGLTVSR